MPRRWEPSTEDAFSLAAFRWFANTIENVAIELYATDRKSFTQVEDILRDTLKELRGVRTRFAVSEEENGCPDGYVLCHGVCAPSCEGDVPQVESLKAGKGKGKGKKR